ncbi:MAG: roadblock/LC7 domain-containing protein [Candidatus Dadabacteria bacterium]|nr:MAG: roadblock/LC7 domain-containing protein [Candidatus Dadabacteria bacterium]
MTLRDGVPQLVVFEEEHRALRRILARVHADSRARAVLLLDVNGQLVAEWGDTSGLDVTSFCSLAASNIAATASMARLVGENDFTILFHQGKRDSIHISLIGNLVILAVIFGTEASLGMVRLRVRRAGGEIEQVLRRILGRMRSASRPAAGPLADITDQDIDELFRF